MSQSTSTTPATRAERLAAIRTALDVGNVHVSDGWPYSSITVDAGYWLLAEVERLEAALEERRDWMSDDVVDAVDRIRDAAKPGLHWVYVQPSDLRKLFASADGLADAYSTVLAEITGGMLSKPTTDPGIAIQIADEKETERFQEYLKDEIAALADNEPPS